MLRIYDDEAQAMEKVKSSSRMLEDAYATGVAILSKYSEQRDHLKVPNQSNLFICLYVHSFFCGDAFP